MVFYFCNINPLQDQSLTKMDPDSNTHPTTTTAEGDLLGLGDGTGTVKKSPCTSTSPCVSSLLCPSNLDTPLPSRNDKSCATTY